MKRLLLISTIIILNSIKLQAQSFTDKCQGIWTGKMEIFNQAKKIADVDIRMTISKIDSTSWSWKTEYLSKNLPITKDYILRVSNAQKGEYLIDEGNGVILKEQLFGNKLLSMFEVKGRLLTSSYEIIGDNLIFEVTSGVKSEDNSGEVTSYNMKNLQRVILSKI